MNTGSRAVRTIETLDPGRSGLQQCRLFSDPHDRVEPGHRLKLDHILAQAILAGVHDLFELGDDGFGSTVDDRVDSDRLTAQPVDVKAQSRFDCGATLRAGTLDQKKVA